MRAVIPDWIVADEEIVVPTAGAVLRDLGLRLRGYWDVDDAATGREAISGRIVWIRKDDVNQLFEMVVDTGEWSVLTEEDSAARRGASFVVGQDVTLIGRLSGVAEYEFEDFDLPDVRADWLVGSAAQADESRYWDVDLTPIERQEPTRRRDRKRLRKRR